jgi:hypothetical protein
MVKVTGSMIIPDSARFTLRTFAACCSIVFFMQNTYFRPLARNSIALSVTVSIAADTIGTFNVIFRENLDLILALLVFGLGLERHRELILRR